MHLVHENIWWQRLLKTYSKSICKTAFINPRITHWRGIVHRKNKSNDSWSSEEPSGYSNWSSFWYFFTQTSGQFEIFFDSLCVQGYKYQSTKSIIEWKTRKTVIMRVTKKKKRRVLNQFFSAFADGNWVTHAAEWGPFIFKCRSLNEVLKSEPVYLQNGEFQYLTKTFSVILALRVALYYNVL